MLKGGIQRDTFEKIDGWNGVTKETLDLYTMFEIEANYQINCLRIKKNKHTLAK